MDFLNHPVLRQLLDQAYEEYGHGSSGPSAMPCDEFLFEDKLHYLGVGTSSNQFSCPLHGFLRSSSEIIVAVVEAAATVICDCYYFYFPRNTIMPS
ncbi:hypothetical protein C1H46_017095 [Malus baccata]|uniref:Uncharacterized protein n=1 Tax=Malus baccata TaxID=106549 RepID=A0A540MEV5_MALBA|nr:hypothetical protein C1H46_017095 [Malus baccata]